MNIADTLVRRFQVEEALRQGPFAYPLPIRLQVSPLSMVPTTGLKPLQLYDIRRHHCISLFPPSPYEHDAYAAMKTFTPTRMAKVPAHPRALQDAKLDPKEVQRLRLIALFKIRQFADVIREGWGAAVEAETPSKVTIMPTIVRNLPRRHLNKRKRGI